LSRRFWDRADLVLAAFDQKQRERFEQVLSAKVSRPTSEEQAAAAAAFATRYRLPIPATVRATRRLTRTSDVAAVIQPTLESGPH
jgi:FAD/FMN-containing dehydrogenase